MLSPSILGLFENSYDCIKFKVFFLKVKLCFPIKLCAASPSYKGHCTQFSLVPLQHPTHTSWSCQYSHLMQHPVKEWQRCCTANLTAEFTYSCSLCLLLLQWDEKLLGERGSQHCHGHFTSLELVNQHLLTPSPSHCFLDWQHSHCYWKPPLWAAVPGKEIIWDSGFCRFREGKESFLFMQRVWCIA